MCVGFFFVLFVFFFPPERAAQYQVAKSIKGRKLRTPEADEGSGGQLGEVAWCFWASGLLDVEFLG